ncbi:putative SH3 domain-containing protein [Desulfosarcina cetonica]|nr:putative SH3 domain-containing protein [Desulfosarcina cetonica]
MTRFYLKRNTGWRNLTIALLVVGLVAGSSAWAGPPMNRSHGDYPQEGQYRQSIPADHQRVRMGGDPMVFHKGVYYRHDPRGYRVVRPPRGTKIDHLPLGVETLLIAGVTYFLLAGIYYQKAPSGYVVVDAPASAPPSPTMAAGQVLAVDTALLNVRSGPGLDHPVVSQARLGERLVVQQTSGGWCFVGLPDGRTGWVMVQYTRPVAPGAQG